MRTVKTYPLVRPALVVAVLLAVAAAILLVVDRVEVTGFLLMLAAAAALAFLALLVRRRVPVPEPGVDLSGRTKDELEAALQGLQQAHARGELPEERHRVARQRIEAELARR